jgi:hypothetical protein
LARVPERIQHALGPRRLDHEPAGREAGRHLTAGGTDMSQAVARTGVRWRLGARTRKSVLVVHIASAGAWLGIDVVMAVFKPWGRIRAANR